MHTPARPAEDIEIRPVQNRRDLDSFIEVPWQIYSRDTNWIPPLKLERRLHLSQDKNPYFQHAEAEFWVAWRKGKPIGRISAQIDQAWLERYQDATGHFGFLEGQDDPALFEALLQTAETWLKARGMKRITGPYSLSVNDECGLLVEGFDRPPALMMGHSRPYYASHVAQAGYHKAMDLLAYDIDVTAPLPPRARMLVDKIASDPKLHMRALDMKHYRQDLQLIVDIFNDAWSQNWGFVPMTSAEIENMAKSLKPIIKPEFVCIAEYDGEPAAMTVTLPDVHHLAADLDGKLLPFGWAKLLWRLKFSQCESGRMPLMGVRRKYQNSSQGAALALGVIDRVYSYHRANGKKRAELSWVLENNRPTRRLIETVGGRADKTYRLYEKELA
ncbi:hypothetical protein [Fodinicurvata sediminis]|uniref:hypothetical protein n=1 Tax=Fodinicurvata sediminis TaxID=1121832 RepID=UPI0003B30762|nr:hypothetical protein [Fodinicurvata sediminis]